MTDKRRLVFSVIQFLNREMASDDHSEDAKESLEVASQCLQTAFTMSSVEDNHLEVTRTLEDIFKEATKGEPVSALAT
jgi:small glutamine-rich tetratricopeptide repeat-containing protein alpha